MKTQELVETLSRGAVSTITTVAVMVISYLEEVEAWLRVVSLMVGIAVGVATFISIINRRGKGGSA